MTDRQAWARDRLDYQFSESAALDRAVTHKSASSINNERLEFLGDAVLGMVIAGALYDARPDASEGELTRLRARLVRKQTLAEIAREIDIARILVVGPGETAAGTNRDSILADAFEAILGALYLDGGVGAAQRVLLNIYRERLGSLPDQEDLKDAKTRLQEALQGQGLALPEYKVVARHGPDHAREFVVECFVESLDARLEGRGTSRQRAEQAAAKATLQVLSRG